MVIKWTPLAREQLQNFIKISKAESHNIKDYINSLVEFANNLLWSKDMGKVMLRIDNVEFKQLLYKKHRIIYYVKNNEIQIVSVVHTSQNLDRAIDTLERYYTQLEIRKGIEDMENGNVKATQEVKEIIKNGNMD